jgi:hypothetical protein
MRTIDGVERGAFAGREALCADLVATGLAVEREGTIRPTLRGFLHADRVARRALGG